MFLKIAYLDDIEKLAGILVKNGYAVKRARRPGKGKKVIHGIEILEDIDIPREDDDE